MVPSSDEVRSQIAKLSEALQRMNTANKAYIEATETELKSALKASAVTATEEYLAQLRLSAVKLGRGRRTRRRHRKTLHRM